MMATTMIIMKFIAFFLILKSCFLYFVFVSLEPIELVPKMVRRPTHLDQYLCRQLHNGLGVRSIAVTNLSGELCRTYCRVIDRIGGKIFYTENISPNFVRCGPYQARCVDGNCIGLNYPYGVITNLIPPTVTQTAIETTNSHNNNNEHSSNTMDNTNNNDDGGERGQGVEGGEGGTMVMESSVSASNISPPKTSLDNVLSDSNRLYY